MIDFATEIKRLLDEYGDEVMDVLEEEAQKVAKKAAKKLQETSPKQSGTYAKGWTSKYDKTAKTAIVYNAKKPGVAHLLEHGFQGRSGVHPAIVHIAPVEEAANDEFVEAVESRLTQ
ncbi:MAG: HK97 gp10 family phage protein [Clostridia bacterium]|nr:HK97 gp10 family phage protein [Clostridia bacterium]